MKIKEQTRKFEVVDETDRVSNHTYGKAALTVV
ncbi:chlorohydrolase [Streptococcus pneumoniae]|nr:chlorohydrolase [Streptococcus pneumoniae]